jgi:hypothetical protein
MYQDPYDSQASHDDEAAQISAMDDTTTGTLSPLAAPDYCGCCGALAASAPKGDHDECCSSLHDTPSDSRMEIISVTPAATASAAARAVAEFDARLIRTAREIHDVFGPEERRAYITAVSTRDYSNASDNVIEGAFTGQLRVTVARLADALERELARNA